jgi:hypothetical protein
MEFREQSEQGRPLMRGYILTAIARRGNRKRQRTANSAAGRRHGDWDGTPAETAEDRRAPPWTRMVQATRFSGGAKVLIDFRAAGSRT